MNADPQLESAAGPRFLLDGEVVELPALPPTRTVLQVLREDLGRTGTKEGCAEGDCGACTVVLLEARGDRLACRAVNSCIQFAGTLDGKALLTAESLNHPEPHPVQTAMVEQHGSQCGFCTPGFVMSLFALYKSDADPGRQSINDALAGNLCRCTGYRPIVDAARAMYQHGRALPEGARDWRRTPAGIESEAARRDERRIAGRLGTLARSRGTVFEHPAGRFFAPRTLAELARLRQAHPQARLLAGGTDVGLWVTKLHRPIGDVLYLGEVAELAAVSETEAGLEIGAAATLTAAMPALVRAFPDVEEMLRRYASPPIRNAATLVGNLANASPIGDSPPVLIALGAVVRLRAGDAVRELPLEQFFVDYQKTALQPGEFVQSVRVPRLAPGAIFRCYKISKRFDQDISAVSAAFHLARSGDRIVSARIAFGGMAATPKRAAGAEQALTGAAWSRESFEAAAAALAADFAPISDMRASAAYRTRVAQNLIRKCWLESAGAGPLRLYAMEAP